MELSLQSAFEKIALLEETAKISIQKVGVVRFDAFSRVGGNQSFAIAFLDKNDNGFVLSSLFAHESSKVYAKPVTKGASKFVISEEEQEAINKALKNHAS